MSYIEEEISDLSSYEAIDVLDHISALFKKYI